MRTILIASVAAIAFTHAAYARTWAWLHGDIGMASPFVSSSSPATNVTARAASKRKPASKRALATKSKSQRTGKVIAAR
jgi:hypothetical protein